MKKWRCTVCNYIHGGDQPPEKCPVCGADKSKFVAVSEQEAQEIQAKKTEKQLERERRAVQKASGQGRNPGPGSRVKDDAPAAGRRSDGKTGWIALVNEQMIKHHAHPVSVHVPNGVLPVSVLFVLLALWCSAGSVGKAAFYNSVVVLLCMPLVLYSGYNAWQRKYGGNLTPIFVAKIAAAGVVTVTCLLVVLWYLLDPAILSQGAGRQAGFVLLNLVMLAAAVVAGWIGGKLVFKD